VVCKTAAFGHVWFDPRILYQITIIGDIMANVKQGNLTKSPQWWKHLKDWKRVFWKSERKAQQKEIKKNLE